MVRKGCLGMLILAHHLKKKNLCDAQAIWDDILPFSLLSSLSSSILRLCFTIFFKFHKVSLTFHSFGRQCYQPWSSSEGSDSSTLAIRSVRRGTGPDHVWRWAGTSGRVAKMRLILSMHKSAAKECAPLGTTSTEKSPTLAQLAIQYHQSQAPSGRRAKKKATLKRLPKRPVPLEFLRRGLRLAKLIFVGACSQNRGDPSCRKRSRRVWPLLPRKLDFFSEIALFTYLRAHTHSRQFPARSFGRKINGSRRVLHEGLQTGGRFCNWLQLFFSFSLSSCSFSGES